MYALQSPSKQHCDAQMKTTCRADKMIASRCAYQHFGEGLAIVGKRLLQLTWKEKTIHEYSLPTLAKVASHPSPCAPVCREGWGLAYDGQDTLYLTDSTDKLFKLDASTLSVKGQASGMHSVECVPRVISYSLLARFFSACTPWCRRDLKIQKEKLI